MEAHTVVRWQGTQIFETVGSLMAVKLSALRIGLPPPLYALEYSFFSFLFEAESIPVP
jgi:hypothetical protein